MKKMDTQFQTPAKQRQMMPRNPIMLRILQVITENFKEMLLNMTNKNVQEALKKFEDTKNKEYKEKKKQINELLGALKKYQNTETQNTINREIN
jgi:hypothetical protein